MTTTPRRPAKPALTQEAIDYYLPSAMKLALGLSERDRAEAARVLADEHATPSAKVTAWRTLQIGKRVRVTTGYLAGREGVIVRIGDLGAVLRLDGEEQPRQYFRAGSVELVDGAPVAVDVDLPALVAA